MPVALGRLLRAARLTARAGRISPGAYGLIVAALQELGVDPETWRTEASAERLGAGVGISANQALLVIAELVNVGLLKRLEQVPVPRLDGRKVYRTRYQPADIRGAR